MADLNFRSDVSMQDADVPRLVLFYLVPEPLTVPARPPILSPLLEQIPYRGNCTVGSQFLRTALKIEIDQHASLDQPVLLLKIGSDPNRCSLVLDRHLVDPQHCRIYAQLNSGFDIWILRDDSTLGTRYRRLKESNNPQNANGSEQLEEEELVHKGCRAIQGLRYLKVGRYEFHCRPSEDKGEIIERDRWFRRHEPIPVNSWLLGRQLAGRRPNLLKKKNIGEGGFGEVFKCMEMQTGLLVAVKKQKVGNDRGVENIRREILSMENLQHRNVAKIIYSSEAPPEEGQRVFHLVMPLFPCSLWNALPMMGSGSKRSAMIQMIEGLKYIHNSGFLHRDIKPENVFISEQTPTNIVLGDLGLLSPVGAIGRMAGTKIYKAPEVYYEDRQTAAIDIFALGVTFIQMLDDRACKGGWRGLKKWVEGLWDHPPPPPCSRLIIQMTAPYPPELRPSLNTIQNLIMQQKDLPESVQGPAMTLGETMKMLEQKHAPPAVIDPPVPMVVPITRLAPLQPRARYSKSRLVPNNYGLHAEIAATKKVVPLDVVHKARGPASPTPAMAAPRHPESSWLKQDPPAYKLKPAQGQPAQSVDFTRPREDPGNIFARQKIKLLEAQLEAEKRLREIDKDQMRLAEDLRNHRRERQRYRKTNQVCHAPYPGEWPSRPTFPGSGSFSKESQFFSDATSKVTSDGHTFLSSLTSSALYTGRSSHRSRGGVSSHIGNDRLGRSARTRINTHARHNERTSKRETVSFQSKLLEGLALALQTGASGIGTTLSKSIRWMLGYRLRD